MINLQRRSDRRREFISRWPKTWVMPEVQNALDGQTIQPGKMPSFENAEMKTLQNHLVRNLDLDKIQRGEFACQISHVSLWMKLAQMPMDTFFVIFEDDAQFGRVFEDNYKQALQFLEANKSKSVFLQMGGVPMQMKKCNDSNLTPIPGMPISQGVRGLCLHAYALTTRMAQILVRDIWQTVPLTQYPIDVHLTHQFRKYPQSCYSMNPLISQSLPQWSSDIQTLWDKLFRVSRNLLS